MRAANDPAGQAEGLRRSTGIYACTQSAGAPRVYMGLGGTAAAAPFHDNTPEIQLYSCIVYVYIYFISREYRVQCVSG